MIVMKFGGSSVGAPDRIGRVIEIVRGRLARKPVVVVTGFIGRTRGGELTTLGRNGSDFTETIIGAALGAEEVEIWSDVDGIMTADPRLVPGAKPLEVLSFAEACELAHYGGKVLHPHTLVPAMRKGIPVRALNTFKPEHPGTRIVAQAAPAHAVGARLSRAHLRGPRAPRHRRGHGRDLRGVGVGHDQ